MKATISALALALLLGSTAQAHDKHRDAACSAKDLAGVWMFATDVGKQTFFPGGDITAIGTFKVDRKGKLEGKFDATVAQWMFLPNVPFTGSFTVNPDCTGALSFVTGAGTTRVDTIIVMGDKIRGMSQDVQFLWTYEMRRLKDAK